MRRTIAEIAGYDPRDPEIQAALDDAREYAALMESLVALRKRSGLTQQDVAAILGTKQSAISQLESSAANPRIRTLFRYARALGSDVRFRQPTFHSNGFSMALTASTAGTIDPIVAKSSRAGFTLAA